MQTANQTVLSLRPGGGNRSGGGGGSRVFGQRVETPILRALSVLDIRVQLLQLRVVVNISDDIILIKQEVESELFGEDGSQGRADTYVQVQSQTRYSEPDTRDWHSKSSQFSAPQTTDLGRSTRK